MKRIAIPLTTFNAPGEPKIVVALPLYKQLPVTWFYSWLQMGKSNCVGLVSTDAVYLPSAMDAMVSTALDKFPDFDWLVVWEHDVLVPPDGLLRVLTYPDAADIVGPACHMHHPPHQLIACLRTWDEEQGRDVLRMVTTQQAKELLDPAPVDVRPISMSASMLSCLRQVDAVSMGFTAIRRRVFENWKDGVPMWQYGPDMGSHDIHFCNEAGKQGFGIYLDSGQRVGHLTETAIGFDDMMGN